jgi:Lrp/AsnC family leucine-responsive transcriptional regulator
MFDEKDVRIMNILQKNARTPNAEIARQLGVAPSCVLERIRKLEGSGVIQGYEARLAPKPVDLGLLAFVFARADERASSGQAGRRLMAFPEVLEVHSVAGEDCYLVKVRAADPEDLARILRERFGSIPQLRSTRSIIVLQTLKESAALPLGQLGAGLPKETGHAA